MSTEETPANAAEPPLIPYDGDVDGPMRRLDMVLRRSPTLTVKPSIAIDGQFHDLEWGRVAFEIPADRTVRVEAWIFLTRQIGRAAYALEAGAPPALEYLAPAAARYPGQLGPPGTVRRKGRLYLAFMLVLLFLALIPLIGVVVLIVASIVRS